MSSNKLKKIVFFNDYATSQIKVPNYHRLLERLHNRVWLNDIRSYVPLNDEYEILCISIQKMLKLPFLPHVIVTSGATEALAIATKTLKPSIVDIYSHNSVVCNLDCIPQVFYVEDKVKVNDINGNPVNVLTYPEITLSCYDSIVVTSEPSFLPAGTTLASNSRLFIREKAFKDKNIIVDYSQSASWKDETDPFIQELYERNYKFCMAFGLHKKLGMFPGTGFLIWPREHNFQFERLYRGGGGKEHFFTPYDGYFQAGTFDYAIINMLSLISENKKNRYGNILSEEEGDFGNFTSTLISCLTDRELTFSILNTPIETVGEDDVTLITAIDESGEVMQMVNDISELQDVKVIYRAGTMCCDLFFNTVKKHKLYTTEKPFDYYLRFSKIHLLNLPSHYNETPQNMFLFGETARQLKHSTNL
jgi:hypothetical protein